MRAMAFAAIIHGANGMLWFHYAGDVADAKKSYSGVFRTAEDWSAMTNLVSQIKALSPVLLEWTSVQPPLPEVISGSAVDPLGQPSVTSLLKEHGARSYLFAVNAANEGVRARFRLRGGTTVVSVAGEKRSIAVRSGVFEDDFEAFGVHIYRFETKEEK